MGEPDLQFVSLYRHWLNADCVSYHLRRSISQPPDGDAGIDSHLISVALDLSAFQALSVYYALLYVVIEGYRENGYKDSEIDTLLIDEEKVGQLRRFRNAIFHYQKDPIPEKLVEFLVQNESEVWIQKINNAFKSFFGQAIDLASAMERFKALTPPSPPTK